MPRQRKSFHQLTWHLGSAFCNSVTPEAVTPVFVMLNRRRLLDFVNCARPTSEIFVSFSVSSRNRDNWARLRQCRVRNARTIQRNKLQRRIIRQPLDKLVAHDQMTEIKLFKIGQFSQQFEQLLSEMSMSNTRKETMGWSGTV